MAATYITPHHQHGEELTEQRPTFPENLQKPLKQSSFPEQGLPLSTCSSKVTILLHPTGRGTQPLSVQAHGQRHSQEATHIAEKISYFAKFNAIIRLLTAFCISRCTGLVGSTLVAGAPPWLHGHKRWVVQGHSFDILDGRAELVAREGGLTAHLSSPSRASQKPLMQSSGFPHTSSSGSCMGGVHKWGLRLIGSFNLN